MHTRLSGNDGHAAGPADQSLGRGWLPRLLVLEDAELHALGVRVEDEVGPDPGVQGADLVTQVEGLTAQTDAAMLGDLSPEQRRTLMTALAILAGLAER